MKSKLLSIVLVFLLLILINGETLALPGDQLIPQPVYGVEKGTELTKLQNSAEQLLYIYDQLQNMRKQLEKMDNQEALIKALWGNQQILEMVDSDFAEMDLSEWREFLEFTLDKFFPDNDVTVDLDDSQPTQRSIEYAKKTNNILSGADNLMGVDDNYSGNLSEEERRRAEVEAKLDNLEKRYSLLNKKYQELQLRYNDYVINDRGKVVKLNSTDPGSNDLKAPENSMVVYIKSKQDELETIEDNINKYGENATVPVLLNISNKLLLQNNDIGLKILMALTDLNTQEYLNNTSDSFEKIRQDYINIKHEELR